MQKTTKETASLNPLVEGITYTQKAKNNNKGLVVELVDNHQISDLNIYN